MNTAPAPGTRVRITLPPNPPLHPNAIRSIQRSPTGTAGRPHGWVKLGETKRRIWVTLDLTEHDIRHHSVACKAEWLEPIP